MQPLSQITKSNFTEKKVTPGDPEQNRRPIPKPPYKSVNTKFNTDFHPQNLIFPAKTNLTGSRVNFGSTSGFSSPHVFPKRFRRFLTFLCRKQRCNPHPTPNVTPEGGRRRTSSNNQNQDRERSGGRDSERTRGFRGKGWMPLGRARRKLGVDLYLG